MNLREGQTVGIDLGTSYSALAQLDKSGEPVILNNSAGSPITASVVVLGDGGKVVVGPTSETAIANPDRIVTAVKRQMGNQDFYHLYENRQLNAEFLSAMILRKLKQDAEAQIGPIANVVITVPYYFNDPCRQATVTAGRIAGLNVIDVINEPTAATLAYVWMKGEFGRLDMPDVEKTILVYDLGGGTFDVTVVNYTPTHFGVVATDGDTFLGGLDWTRRLVNHVSERFQQKFGVDPRDDPRTRLALTEECDHAKQELSTRVRTLVDVSYLGRSASVAVSRGDLERLTADLLQRTRDTTELVLEQGGVDPRRLDDVLLVGGSTNLPCVRQMIEQLCRRHPSQTLDPQLAVAQGAAIHAALLEAKATGGKGRLAGAVIKRLQAVRTTDVNSHSLGVELTDPNSPAGKRNHIMIPRNTRLPSEVQQRFVTSLANPEGIQIRLLEGEASDVTACTFIGDFRITNLPPNLPAGSPVEITYRYDASRHVQVSARELVGNNQASVEIVWEGALNHDAVSNFRTLANEYHIH